VATDLWAPIERSTRNAFGQLIDQSSSRLLDSLDCGARYVKVDAQSRQLVFDRRAFLFGVLRHGLRGKTSDLPDEGDIWLADWFLRQGVIRGTDENAVPSGNDDAVTQASTDAYQLVLSTSMQRIVANACDYAARTTRQSVADLRHLVAALMLYQGDWPPELGWKPTLPQIGNWCETLFKHINSRRGLSDDRQAWLSILLPNASPVTLMSLDRDDTADPAMSSVAVEEAVTAAPVASPIAAAADDRVQLAGFNADRPGGAVPGDPLGIDPDVNAFARLIAARDTTLPLSIGIFGDWGTGKSTFMERLEAAINRLLGSNRRHFVDRIIHIRFNAWQFADANLWASLTAEFFEQLRVGGHAKQIDDRYGKLVERVNSHVHALSEGAAAARDALADSKKALVAAQQERDKAVKAVAKVAKEELSQSVLDAVGEAYDRHRDELADLLGIAEDQDGDKALDQFLTVAKDLRSIGGQLKVIRKSICHGGWRRLFAVITCLSLFLLIYFSVEWFWDTVDRPAALLLRYGGWTALAGLGTALAAAAPAIKVAAGILHSTAGFAGKLDKVSSAAQKKVLQSEINLRSAALEAKARQEAVDRASRALARYVGPDSAANPPRLLRYVLEDFPDTKEMEKEIGLISRARRLFESVDAIVQQERRRRIKGGGTTDVEVPDRIVLYIDDLDRCTPEQVYAVLQAIHLLLAFELFVVVVSVDVHWIEEALGKQSGLPDVPEGLGDKAQLDSLDLARRIRAIRYLEKIFQLPFWLRPLTIDGIDGGSYGRYVRALTTVSNNDDGDRQQTAGATTDEVAGAGASGVRDQAGADAAQDTASDTVAGASGGAAGTTTAATGQADAATEQGEPAEAIVDSFAAMELSPNEIDFLASPAIGRLAAKDPRAVKRLINVYRILRASLTPVQLRRLIGADQAAPDYPIAIFLIAVDVGQPLQIADELYRCLKSWNRGDVFNLPQMAKETGEVPDDLRPLVQIFRQERALGTAWDAVEKARNASPASIETCVDLARAIRRYSFNKY
jgi:hypothetical protein